MWIVVYGDGITIMIKHDRTISMTTMTENSTSNIWLMVSVFQIIATYCILQSFLSAKLISFILDPERLLEIMGENEEWEGDEENDPDYNPFDLEVGEYWRDV